LINEDESLKRQIVNHFGNEAYVDGKLNRSHLAKMVFNDKEKLALLNSLTHPAVMHDSEEWVKLQTAPYTIREAALIFESGISKYLDYVIGVSSPETLRIHRTINRDAVTRNEVLARMKNQLDEHEKMRLCDFVIHNDEEQLVMPQVLALHKKISEL
jgi:dephospho-CoA kinase